MKCGVCGKEKTIIEDGQYTYVACDCGWIRNISREDRVKATCKVC